VSVNGKTVQTPDYWVDFARDKVMLDGKPVRAGKKIYLLLYKPKGYLTTYRDPEGRPTVYDLIGDAGTWLSPVGRLDLDTSGLDLTNDTQFAEGLQSEPDSQKPIS
jgi:16S rRNA U516 pseudouridylate synthase RsuA-like enzyme